MPTLSASAAKTVNKTPLTPRVAVSNTSVTPSPLPRKEPRYENTATPTGSRKEELSTPVSAFLNTNITPRSSSRKTRGIESGNTTPSHTPTGSATPDVHRFVNDRPVSSGGGLNISALELNGPKRPTVSFSPALSEAGSQRDQSQSEADTKFFYASDAQSAASQPRQQRPALESKTSSFFYANGEAIPPPISSSGSAVGSIAGSSVGEDRSQPKFFHANGTPDLRLQPSNHVSTTSPNVSNSRPAPRLAARSAGLPLSPLQRPPSPTKFGPSVPPSTLKHASALPSPLATRSQTAQEIPSVRSNSGSTSRRASGHERAASTSVLDMSPSVRRVSNAASTVPSSPLHPMYFPIMEVVSTPEELMSEPGNDEGSVLSDLQGPQSPVKTGHTLEHMNELAANARRERKVLDLEITNSSLAAINRTLEREMRKQTAELRRYRRLSRSGRLSILSSASMRTSTTSFGMTDVDGMPLSDMSEEDSEDEEDTTSEEESIDEGSLSPGAMAESDLRHRKKDEKRLQLDLSKHQQLLVDSQNMNQSLKRCLGWTEELINEGKKALAYNVRVSDIELGGRVLAPNEEEEDHEPRSPGTLNPVSQSPPVPTTYGDWRRGSKDGWDSGIELGGGHGFSTIEEAVSSLNGLS
jgi:hypothetical protein